MKFKFILVIFILLLSACGYQSLYKIDKGEFSIISFKSSGSDVVSKQLTQNFKKLQNNKEAKKYYETDTDSKIDIVINSKNSKGKADSYSLRVTVDLIIKENDLVKQKKTFSEKTDYVNLDNKFELKQYENMIINGQTEKIIENINNFLNSL